MRSSFYGCASCHDRGKTVCTNAATVPMSDADAIVIEALLDDVLDETMITDAVDEAARIIQGDSGSTANRLAELDAELAMRQAERRRPAALAVWWRRVLADAPRTRGQSWHRCSRGA
jgi:hypothetical protein